MASPLSDLRRSPNPAHGLLGRRIRSARLARGLSTHRLGLWLTRPHDMISRWERGLREPTLFDLDQLATVLRADMDELLAGLPAIAARRGCSSRAHPRSRRIALGQTLARLRSQAELGVWDVYQATGIDARQLCRIEAGADPSVGEAVLLIKLYGTTPNELIRAAKAQRRRNLDNEKDPPSVTRSLLGTPPRSDGTGA